MGIQVNGVDTALTGVNKIDETAVDGLSGISNSLAYRVEEIENHLHSAQQIYGLTANTMARKAVIPIVVTGGNGAWGTELELHNGTVIESGSATKKFDMHEIYVITVGNANRVTMLEFYNNSLAEALTSVAIDETAGAVEDMFTKTAHGYLNNDKIMLSSIVTTTGINIYTVYYVVNKTDNYFQISKTLGGAVVSVTSDGTCSTQKITTTLISEAVVSKSAVNVNAKAKVIQMGRQLCNSRISCRGWAAGGTNAISFFVGLHTYTA